MNAAHYASLRAGVNFILEGRQCSPLGTRISTEHLLVYARDDVGTIEEAISKWERAGMIRILKPFRSCQRNEDCIEANQFIEEKSPIKGWLNWQ